MYLNKEEERILDGYEGEMLSKLMRFLVEIGDSFEAEKLIEIVSAHTVLNIGLSICRAAADILHRIAESGLKVKVRTTADPIPDIDYAKDLDSVYSLFGLHEQMMEDLAKIGVHGFTCTPYYLDNKPKLGQHCAWSESSAVIYLNSVLGARSNREGGILDVASGILGKTPYYGLHLSENRKGQVLYKIGPDIDTNEIFNLTSIGLKIGETAGHKIPVIDGLGQISTDNLKNLGSASASTGAVALIHVPGITPEVKSLQDAFEDKPEEVIEIEMSDLKEMKEKYSTEWQIPPKTIAIGCPQLSREETINVIKKLSNKKIDEHVNFWICTNVDVKNYILNSEYKQILDFSGAKITTICPTYIPPPKPTITNSAKSCYYSPATYRTIDECIRIATEGRQNE
jgi:predicted aconitase